LRASVLMTIYVLAVKCPKAVSYLRPYPEENRSGGT
jgi:hypothetical protein